MAHDGGNMLVYYAILHVLIAAFGNGILVIRTPSAIASACTVALASLFAKRFFGNAVAAATGLVSAVSLPLVFWGQDARAYAIMTALVAGSFLAFAALVEAEPGTRASRWAFACYVAATTLSLYMSFIAVLVVPAQLLALACYRRRLRLVLSAAGGLGAVVRAAGRARDRAGCRPAVLGAKTDCLGNRGRAGGADLLPPPAPVRSHGDELCPVGP